MKCKVCGKLNHKLRKTRGPEIMFPGVYIKEPATYFCMACARLVSEAFLKVEKYSGNVEIAIPQLRRSLNYPYKKDDKEETVKNNHEIGSYESTGTWITVHGESLASYGRGRNFIKLPCSQEEAVRFIRSGYGLLEVATEVLRRLINIPIPAGNQDKGRFLSAISLLQRAVESIDKAEREREESDIFKYGVGDAEASQIPKPAMIKGKPGHYELVDAFTHKHIKWLSDKEMEEYKTNPFRPPTEGQG